MQTAFEQQQRAFRQAIPHAGSEELLKFFAASHWMLAQRAFTAGLGINDDDPQIDQQYRLTTYAVTQELLKRLHVL